MNSFKFRAWLPQLGKDIHSGVNDWAILFAKDITAIDGYGDRYKISPRDIQPLLGFETKFQTEIYNGDVIENSAHNGLTPCGEPLSAELTVVLADKYRRHYFAPADVYSWLFGHPSEFKPSRR